ncbi:MAG: DUF6056 family protein [Eubacteriales bacterium]
MKKYGYMVVFAITFLIMLVLNVLSPMIGDDYTYSMSIATGLKNQSVMDVVESMVYHYESWGGRIFAHTLASLFLMMPMYFFDICNSIMFVLLGYLIYRFVVVDDRGDVGILILIYMTLFLCIPAFAQTVLWLTGSCNYLWTTTTMIGFLLPYRIYCKTGVSMSKWMMIPYLLLAFLAGGSNEHVSASILLCAGLLTLFTVYKKVAIRVWMILGLVVGFLGWIIMIMAPGNYVRLEESIVAEESRRYILVRYAKMFAEATQHFSNSSWVLFGVILLMVLAFYHKLKKENILIAGFLLIGALLGHYAMIFVDQYAERAYIGIQICIIMAGLVLYYQLNTAYSHLLKQIVLAFVALQFSLQLVFATVPMITSYVDYIDREKIIADSIQQGIYEVETYAIKSTNSYNVFGLNDISTDATYWSNVRTAKYYGLVSIQANETRYH